MPRHKLKKFIELKTFQNVLQIGDLDINKKIKKFIGKENKIILELGCGKGEYSVALAEKNPHNKYVGLDIQGERLWHGARLALDKNLANIIFIRFQAEHLNKIFSKHSVDEIWLTFPDPYPRKKQAKKRLVSPQFLKIYKSLLKDNGLVHLKTDDKKLFNFAIASSKIEGFKINKKIIDIYKHKKISPDLMIKTYFEEKHLKAKKKIYYLKIEK
ncbi:MAG: tRNA (guanosine(46)-N7)-methyltransferase TrmB [Patescibacteria group bacterium]|jgi:tRNA (guanine-N7-)-methyltransferase